MTASVVQVDAGDLVATVETAREDIGDVIWEMLVPKKVVHLGSLLPRSVAGSAEAVVLPLLSSLTMAFETP